ncbi:3-dehydroquinate synthase [Desulfobacterota bacterium AH_259_B03_O07]|nr:3-dehydroquinate synthase [Desulfobacterota bacterium AH_259_B03_O07]
MERIKVNLRKTEDNSYEIVIGKKLLKKIPLELKKNNLAHSYAIITDSNVSSIYGKKLIEQFKKSKIKTILISFPAGEKSKNRGTKVIIENEMLKAGMARDSAVIALGGGVVGDVAGFVAATFNRGIPYVQVPTTLVASVDSSIGGKTGIDTLYGKNLIGAFHQPYRVYIDVETLTTLDKKEIREGLAEIIKYCVIRDEKLFGFIEKNMNKIFSYRPEILIPVIKKCCEIKGNIVELDEKESNLRKILNFGHTIGHAIENLLDYKITHGESISMGMITEGKIALQLGILKREDLERLHNLLKKAGLPTRFPVRMDLKKMMATMKLDKKARRGKIEMVLPKKIGEMSETKGNFAIKIANIQITKALDIG